MGLVHRDEPGGTLHGLLRLRQFTQDDGHIFCSAADAEDEVLRFCQAVPGFYRAFGFDEVRLALSTRPAARAGDDGLWDRAEAALLAVLQRLGVPYTLQPGAGAFYGPKLEYVLRDRLGRDWQCGTIQFDLVMPEHFDLRYVDDAGERQRPVMLHRALYGSLERFLGILLEHHGAALPAWLAPVQVVVLPITDAEGATAAAFAGRLGAAGVRTKVDGDGSLARRIAAAHEQAAPFVAIIGAREAAQEAVTLRTRAGQRVWQQPAAVDELRALCRPPEFAA
jgi:threonyl-tRNA synthetase